MMEEQKNQPIEKSAEEPKEQFMDDSPKIIRKKNDLCELEITGVDADGFGIGRDGNFAVFVDGALPGDKITARLLKVKPRYAFGKIEKIKEPSPHRRESRCIISSRCGGCQWQHCGYAAQLAFKKNIVEDALTRIGKIENPPVADVIGMANPYGYRGKAVFPIGGGQSAPSERQETSPKTIAIASGVSGHSAAVGIFAARSHRVIPVTHCNIQHPVHVKIIEVINNFISEIKVPAYDEKTHTGLLRHVMIRVSFHTREVMVSLVINGYSLPHEMKLTARLTDAGASTVLVNIHKQRGNAVMGDKFRILSGSGFIRERIGHIEYILSPRSFFQVNPVQTEVLYAKAIEAAGLTGNGNVIDAHAGVGGVGLFAARRAKKVYGIEIVPESVEDARKNAELNGIANAEFILGAAETALPELIGGEAAAETENGTGGETTGEKFDVIFLDPPRKGCGAELLDAIVNAQIGKVVYISCDPATLARDIKILADGGYELISTQPVDMFPQTGKVECVCTLVRTVRRST